MTKKNVTYDPSYGVHPIADFVLLHPLNHPDFENMPHLSHVRTTKVLSWDKETGLIETENTVYTPI